jgi:type I restriction enzyme S subunit
MQPCRVDARFLRYICLWRDFIDAVDASTYGTKMPRADWDFIGTISIPVPEPAKQRIIGEFLDRETARLDALIAAKERLLKLLAEKRRALITRAVTRGLDPNGPLRDSGIRWLGKIPAHWKIKRGKWLFTERDERSINGEETLLSLRMERGLVPHNEVSEKQTKPVELVGYKRTSPGELVINRMRAAIGLIAVTPQEGLVSPDYAVFVPTSITYVDYYLYLFTTELLGSVFRSSSTGMGTGTSGFLRLYSESFLALWFPFPPVDEQRSIVEFINRETRRLDEVRTATKRTITLLKERRASLIAAAVTGQVNIKGAA